jgi:hypothetical protein
MTITDLESNGPLTIRIWTPLPQFAPTPPSTALYTIMLLIGVLPRYASFPLPPTATLAEVEPAVRAKWDLEGVELEFGLHDIASDEITIVAKSTQIGSLDLGTLSLIVRQAVTPDDASAPPPADGAAEGALLRSLRVSVGSTAPGLLTYTFYCEDRAEEFQLKFAPGTKVKEAREALGTRFGIPTEAVALHFMGKALRDGFMMERLRVGDTKIQIYLKDSRPVVLMSARANRRPA